jgi:hypothetical protein
MSNKKLFLLGMLTGAISLAALGGIVMVGLHFYEIREDSAVIHDVAEEEEEIQESTAVFADSGNPVLTDGDKKYNIEVVLPEGFSVGGDYESAYSTECYNENQSVRIEYTIETYTAEEMQSFYEFDKGYYENSADGKYSNVSSTPVSAMDVNGYAVNYLSMSYTYDGSESHIEYCAYVMLDDATEFMCTIAGKTADVSEEMIQNCFNSKLPVTQ